MGSSELARVSALGWRRRATRMKRLMHGTETTYIVTPMRSTGTRAAGMADPVR